jgi:hypothetical protein
MKVTATILMSLVVSAVVAQDEIVQTGTPALLEAANGKKAKVFLQRLEGGNLTFQPFKSPKDMTVPSSKIKSLGFSMNKEEFDFFREQNVITEEEISGIFSKPDLGSAEKLQLIFAEILDNIAETYNQGDYAGLVSAIEPIMRGRGEYMSIENNLDGFYAMLMESYRKLDDFTKVKQCAAILQESSDAGKVEKAKVCLALVAVAEKDFPAAEAARGELGSEAASLYVKASIERAQDNPKEAIQTVTTIIAEHGNDLEWLPQSELLNAYLYLDMTGSNSVITTNSALNTARQVKNMYGGSNVAGDARKLWASLGGEKIEAEEKAEKAALAAAAKEAKAKRAAAAKERKAAAKAKRDAEKAAQAAAATSANSNTTTEMESE